MCQCLCTGTAPDDSGLGGEVGHSVPCVSLASQAITVLLSVPSTSCVVAKIAFYTFKHKSWLGAEDVPHYVPSVRGAWSPHPSHPLAMRCLQGWVFTEILNGFSSPCPDKHIHSAVYVIGNTPAADWCRKEFSRTEVWRCNNCPGGAIMPGWVNGPSDD